MTLLLAASGSAQGASVAPSLAVSPTAGPVGAKVTVRGAGFPSDAGLNLEWNSAVASWVITGNPPQVSGTKVVPQEKVLGQVRTNSSGSFSVEVVLPPDFGGRHYLQAFLSNGTALSAKATFTLEPSFHISPTSGPDGTPIAVTATGLGNGLYSTSYHLYWDNSYTGYMTAITTGGSTNFTVYASGLPGVHYVQVYQGYPGPGYLNPQQGPPSSETQSIFPPLIPYLAEFNVTSASAQLAAGKSSGGMVAFLPLTAAAVAGLAGGGLFLLSRRPQKRSAVSKALVVFVVVVLLAAAAVAAGVAFMGPSSTRSGPAAGGTAFSPQATVVRPAIAVPVSNATSGPRIAISPSVAGVGGTVTVSGNGFAAGSSLPLTWATRLGNNLHGYQLVNEPLRNVTASGSGSFSFTMKVPPDLGGLHFISAGNLTPSSNGTLFLQRTCTVSPTQGPPGTIVSVACLGVGWDYNTNIVAVDYDNSYLGYACGFNSGGNATVDLVATGAPGVHTIDVYPSIWWGPSGPTSQLLTEYRYPLLTPQDHPELMPSFHFSFLITAPSQASQPSGDVLPQIGAGSSAAAVVAIALTPADRFRGAPRTKEAAGR